MKKLWKNTKTKSNKLVDKYCFKEGVELDNSLVIYDVYGSIAHAKMLSKIGILKEDEFKKLNKVLIEIINLYKNGNFEIVEEDEDVHTKIENYLTEKLGDLGKKIHTGRSRNDQISVDLRLYSKEKLSNIDTSTHQLIEAFIKFAKKHEFVPMPGYTHMQKAMPSSVGMWAGSFAEQLVDQLEMLKSVYKLNDQSPLGSGAAYGVSLPINRELTAKLLGFSKVQNNALYCQISRPTIQLSIIQVLTQIMLCASRFAQDLLLFTTSEFNFFEVDESICTGSSIMPQKKNLDLMEYVRSKTHVVISNQQLLSSMTAGLPSGYNADFGQTKKPFMESFEITLQTIDVVMLTVNSIKPNLNILIKSCSPEIYSTHYAYELVKKGLPFREAYLQIKNNLKNIKSPDPVSFLKKSNHSGGTNNLKLDSISSSLRRAK
ncbi:argininosuccinate lyase [Candidatus Roizmanbacteria bacterium CG_4_9_14_3_um_filter_33_18]|uniref:Argininosuccinate lyase n=1 Tax=Candidatus Roizmanbacteria bacterium CG_4_9_14_3_um_filter_33_18 TaxID=1974841 RepID=A0A2M7XYP3_9BACT|nr:MAG: argininosuccinate lyase [Candidatus Roizmanbacteria bacterium CG_4_9_14_3_um_filter_33_18]